MIGIPRLDFLREAKKRRFASTKERRLIIARTDDVITWLEQRLSQVTPTPPVSPSDPETISLARVGARRVR